MREENFIAFWLVSGFFIGLLVGFWKENDPFYILLIVGLVTFFFYLLALLSVAFFVRFMEFGKIHFEKDEYERKLDAFYDQLLKREANIDLEHATFDERGLRPGSLDFTKRESKGRQR